MHVCALCKRVHVCVRGEFYFYFALSQHSNQNWKLSTMRIQTGFFLCVSLEQWRKTKNFILIYSVKKSVTFVLLFCFMLFVLFFFFFFVSIYSFVGVIGFVHFQIGLVSMVTELNPLSTPRNSLVNFLLYDICYVHMCTLTNFRS